MKEAISGVVILIKECDSSEWKGWSIGHRVGLNHKPYCGAPLEGKEWQVTDRMPTVGEMGIMCSACILKEVNESMEANP